MCPCLFRPRNRLNCAAPREYDDGEMSPDARRGRRVKPYTTREAAAILGVSQRTVIRLCEAELLDHYWTPGHGQRRIRVSALEDYVRRNG